MFLPYFYAIHKDKLKKDSVLTIYERFGIVKLY